MSIYEKVKDIESNFSVYTNNNERVLYSYEVSRKINETVNSVSNILGEQKIT